MTCSAEDQITSNWVGLDGFNSCTVEQLGTISWCFQGTPTYFTWYEMFPAGTVEVGTTLKPGDKITASVTRTGTSYALKLTDSTTSGNNISVTKTCALATCVDTSAEWISERPSFSIGIVPQAHYNAFKLTSGSVTANGKTTTIGCRSRRQRDHHDRRHADLQPQHGLRPHRRQRLQHDLEEQLLGRTCSVSQ